MNSAKHATNFQADIAPPDIVSFDLDLDANTLTLSFSEAVLINKVNLDMLQLVSSPSGEVVRQLNGGQIHATPLEAASTIVFTLTEEDLTYLETSHAIATNTSNTYIAALSGVANDTSCVQSNPLPIANAKAVQMLTLDGSVPHLIDFTFDLNTGKIILSFDDAVDASTLDVNLITFQNVLFVNLFNGIHLVISLLIALVMMASTSLSLLVKMT